MTSLIPEIRRDAIESSRGATERLRISMVRMLWIKLPWLFLENMASSLPQGVAEFKDYLRGISVAAGWIDGMLSIRVFLKYTVV